MKFIKCTQLWAFFPFFWSFFPQLACLNVFKASKMGVLRTSLNLDKYLPHQTISILSQCALLCVHPNPHLRLRTTCELLGWAGLGWAGLGLLGWAGWASVYVYIAIVSRRRLLPVIGHGGCPCVCPSSWRQGGASQMMMIMSSIQRAGERFLATSSVSTRAPSCESGGRSRSSRKVRGSSPPPPRHIFLAL